MNVGANFLTGLRGPKYSHDGNLGPLGSLRRPDIVAQLRVISRWLGLVMIDAVEPDPEQVHAYDQDVAPSG